MSIITPKRLKIQVPGDAKMFRKLRIDELKTGMYVSGFQKEGSDKALFFMNNLLVKNEKELEEFYDYGYRSAYVVVDEIQPEAASTPPCPESHANGGEQNPEERAPGGGKASDPGPRKIGLTCLDTTSPEDETATAPPCSESPAKWPEQNPEEHEPGGGKASGPGPRKAGLTCLGTTSPEDETTTAPPCSESPAKGPEQNPEEHEPGGGKASGPGPRKIGLTCLDTTSPEDEGPATSHYDDKPTHHHTRLIEDPEKPGPEDAQEAE